MGSAQPLGPVSQMSSTGLVRRPDPARGWSQPSMPAQSYALDLAAEGPCVGPNHPAQVWKLGRVGVAAALIAVALQATMLLLVPCLPPNFQARGEMT